MNALVLAATFAAIAPGATVQLTQGAFTDGAGPMTIEFAGQDSNGDGAIDTSELAAFTATFGIPGGGVALWSLPDLGIDGFGWESPASYFIKGDNSLYSFYEFASAGTYIAIVSDFAGSEIWLSDAPLRDASAVPEPSTVTLTLLSALAVLALARQKSQAFLRARPQKASQ